MAAIVAGLVVWNAAPASTADLLDFRGSICCYVSSIIVEVTVKRDIGRTAGASQPSRGVGSQGYCYFAGRV